MLLLVLVEPMNVDLNLQKEMVINVYVLLSLPEKYNSFSSSSTLWCFLSNQLLRHSMILEEQETETRCYLGSCSYFNRQCYLGVQCHLHSQCFLISM